LSLESITLIFPVDVKNFSSVEYLNLSKKILLFSKSVNSAG
jgi:hypothetical protein